MVKRNLEWHRVWVGNYEIVLPSSSAPWTVTVGMIASMCNNVVAEGNTGAHCVWIEVVACKTSELPK